MQVVCVKCGDDGGCWGYEDLIPTLQTPAVADCSNCSTQHRTICTIGRRRHSDTYLLITATSPGCYCTQMRLTLSGMEGTPLVSRCCAGKLSPSLSSPQRSISPPHVTSAARSGGADICRVRSRAVSTFVMIIYNEYLYQMLP